MTDSQMLALYKKELKKIKNDKKNKVAKKSRFNKIFNNFTLGNLDINQ